MKGILIYNWECLRAAGHQECQFEVAKKRHVILLPGLSAYVGLLFPLVRFLRERLSGWGVTAIPLGLNANSFEMIVDHAVNYVERGLFAHAQVTEVVFIGHSFGGRVAAVLVQGLQKLHPGVKFGLITAGSPLSSREKYFRWMREKYFTWLSIAYREWKPIVQPDPATLSMFIGFYSDYDRTVKPHIATRDYRGTLVKLDGFTHMDFLKPEKFGSYILTQLRKFSA